MGCYILPLTGVGGQRPVVADGGSVVLTVLTGPDYVYLAHPAPDSARAMRPPPNGGPPPRPGQRHANRHRRLRKDPDLPTLHKLSAGPGTGPRARGRSRSAPRSAPPRSRGAGCCGTRRTRACGDPVTGGLVGLDERSLAALPEGSASTATCIASTAAAGRPARRSSWLSASSACRRRSCSRSGPPGPSHRTTRQQFELGDRAGIDAEVPGRGRVRQHAGRPRLQVGQVHLDVVAQPQP